MNPAGFDQVFGGVLFHVFQLCRGQQQGAEALGQGFKVVGPFAEHEAEGFQTLLRQVAQAGFGHKGGGKASQLIQGHGAHEMGIAPFELGGVKGGGGGVKIGAVEIGNEFFFREELLIAVGPAQAHQVVNQGLGQQAVLFVLDDGARAVAFGELLTVGAKNHGHMAEARHGQAQGFVDEDLARGVGDVIGRRE